MTKRVAMINPRLIAYLTGWIVLFTGLGFLLPLIPAYIYDDGSAGWFWQSLAVSIFLGLILLAIGGRESDREARYRDSLAIVGLTWFLVSLLGSLPYIFSGHLDVFGAIFESFSGFSSTGATVIVDLNTIPRGLLFWRSFSQWLGGMGIIVLMVAVLPFLGVGGQMMLKSETSGPSSDKLRPRVTQTAKILWGLYLSLTVLILLLLLVGGVGFFDALCQALGTISTGGFSNHNESVAFFHSRYVQWVIVIFMFIGSISFSLYWQALKGQWRNLVFNREVMFLFFLVLAVTLISSVALVAEGSMESLGEAFFRSLFQTVSVVSTSGLSTDEWTGWPHLSQAVLFFLFFVGGCSGSTSGGVKCIRWIILVKSINRACRRLIHPRGVFPVRLHDRTLNESVLEGVWQFFLIYFLTMAIVTLTVTALGLDLMTAFTAAVSTLGNIGPALGQVGATGSYADFPSSAKVVLSLCMLLGRLEFYSFVVLFFPEFWRK
jgi:trk system potassium uptake protein TrkH